MVNPQFVVCINNSGYEVSLEVRKLYQLLPDKEAAKHHQLRVIDESGEDYLFPETFFLSLPLPKNIADKIVHAA